MKAILLNVACCSPCSGLVHYMTNSSSPVDYSVLRMNSDRHITGREVGFSYSTAVETTVTKQEDSLPPALKRYWCAFAQYAKRDNAAHVYQRRYHHYRHHRHRGLARVHAAVISSQSQQQRGHRNHGCTAAALAPCMARTCPNRRRVSWVVI